MLILKGLSLWEEAGRGIAAFLCKAIYKLIAWLYELFVTIARVNILSSDEIAPIYQRVTMILTIVMVFYITFEFVKYVVQPDTINDKEKGVGNITLKMIAVILLIAFVPRIFTMAYSIQGKILEQDVISKVILGKTNTDMNSYGKEFASDVFKIFYKVNEEACQGCGAEAIVKFNIDRLRKEGDLRYLTNGLNDTNKIKSPSTGTNEEVATIDFDGIFAVLVGAAIAYVLVLYCVDVGTRYAQLVFLQVISPIAIMGYLTPKKDNMFSKWLKQCLTTYLNLFIRIAVIYFVLLLCKVLGDAYGDGKLFEGLGEISNGIKGFTYIALVLGLLVFANKAPKMLQELFPSSGAAGIGMGLRSPSKVLSEAPLLGRALGMTYAGAGSILKNTRKSAGQTIDALKEGNYKKAGKAIIRGTLGNIGAGFTGMWLGVQSKDIAGMKRAMKNSYDRTQAKYKIQDTGYNMLNSRFWSDKFRSTLLMDEHIEDIAGGQDLAVQALQQQIMRIQQKDGYDASVTIQKSKANPDKYLIYQNGKFTGEMKESEILPEWQDNKEVADLNAQLGKAQSQAKALHQKENETKEKK